MKIGIVSDTHSREIPKQLLNDFKKVNLIVHAGDVCSLKSLKIFTRLQEVKGVYGNMDDADIRKKFPARQVFRFGNFSIGLCHGGVGPANKVLDFVKDEFKNDKVDVIIFGHSHQPINQWINGILYFNPGSPNDIVFAPYCSYGILEINEDKIIGKIVKVK